METGVAARVIKNTGHLIASGVVVQLLGFVSIFYLARILGPADFGLVAFASAIVTYFGLLADLGVPLSGTQQIARNRTKIEEGYVLDVCALRLVLAFISMVLLFLLALVIPKSTDVKVLLLLFGITLFPSAALI